MQRYAAGVWGIGSSRHDIVGQALHRWKGGHWG